MLSTHESRAKTVREYDQLHDELLIHAVNRYGTSKAIRKIDEFLGKRAASNFSLLNRHARHVFRTNLQMQVEQVWPQLKRDELAIGLFTFIDRSWVTNEEVYKVDLVSIKQKVRNALAGASYIAAIEHAIYSNKQVTINGKTAKMLCVHVHAIVWDTSVRQLERRRTRAAKRFTPVFASHKGQVNCSKLEGLEDFLDTLGYMAKVDVSTQRLLDPEGNRQKIVKTSLRSRFKRFEQLQDEILFHYWFAGGSGSPILRAAVCACRTGSSFSRADIRRFITNYESGERERRAKRMEKSRRRGIFRQRRTRD